MEEATLTRVEVEKAAGAIPLVEVTEVTLPLVLAGKEGQRDPQEQKDQKELKDLQDLIELKESNDPVLREDRPGQDQDQYHHLSLLLPMFLQVFLLLLQLQAVVAAAEVAALKGGVVAARMWVDVEKSRGGVDVEWQPVLGGFHLPLERPTKLPNLLELIKLISLLKLLKLSPPVCPSQSV